MGEFDIARQLRPALYQSAQNMLVHHGISGGFRAMNANMTTATASSAITIRR
jgi:hypothetical protein